MGFSSKLISEDWVHTQSEADTYESRISHEMKRKPQSEPMMKCPRCHSTNTKFCYYNNYTKSQPRYFCRSCKRHWTQGGSLRNVPVGGGRKNKRLKTQTTTAKAAASTTEEDTSFLPKDLSYNNGGYGAFEGLFQFPIQNKSLQIPYPSISSFENDPSSCYHRGDPETEATESSTMASSVFTTSDAVDARCWGWDDIGAFVSVDLGLPWEDY